MTTLILRQFFFQRWCYNWGFTPCWKCCRTAVCRQQFLYVAKRRNKLCELLKHYTAFVWFIGRVQWDFTCTFTSTHGQWSMRVIHVIIEPRRIGAKPFNVFKLQQAKLMDQHSYIYTRSGSNRIFQMTVHVQCLPPLGLKPRQTTFVSTTKVLEKLPYDQR